MREHNWHVVASDEVALAAAQRHVRKAAGVTVGVVAAHAIVEELEEGLVFKAGRKVLYASVVEEELLLEILTID